MRLRRRPPQLAHALIRGSRPARACSASSIDATGARRYRAPDGVLLTDRLADELACAAATPCMVEVLEGKRRTARCRSTGTVREMMGLNAYMELRATEPPGSAKAT